MKMSKMKGISLIIISLGKYSNEFKTRRLNKKKQTINVSVR